MPLRLAHVGFSYRSDVPLLDDVDLHLVPGWTGLVGPNGGGKTTLLRLLAGELSPLTGSRDGPPSTAAQLCPQRSDARTEAVEAFAWGFVGPHAWALQARLGLDPADLERWETLSPGQRKRWQVGAALAARPEVLLLDEPSNHLDGDGRAWLVQALQDFDGIGVLVSHDRALLEALVQTTVRVRHGRVEVFPGPFADACAQWEREAVEARRRLQEASREAARARRQLADARRRHDAVERQRSASRRMRGRDDHDGRSMGAQFRADKAAARLGRQVATTRREAEARLAERSGIEVEVDPGGALSGDWERSPRSRLLELRREVLRAGDRPLLRGVDLHLEREDHVWVQGPNGSGKTTLVRALLDEATLPPDRVLVLPQALDAAEASSLLERVLAHPPDLLGRVMQVVAALGVEPERLRRTEAPSPGEARKLALADGLARRVWLLVLDEPTNHLDLPSVERIGALLRDWPGALLLVTHDAHLGAECSTVRWRLCDGRVEVEGPPWVC